MGQINVYGLGEHGINRVKSPVHVIDGELLSCQNATTSPIGAQLGLKKRDGMVKINSSAAAGSIIAIANIPFANPTGLGTAWVSPPATGLNLALRSIAWSPTLAMFVAVGDNDVSGNAMRSTDGISWTAMNIGSGRNLNQVIWASGDNLFIVSGANNGTTAPIFYSADGINWTNPTTVGIFSNNRHVSVYSPDLDRYVAFPWEGSDSIFPYSSDVTNWTHSNVLPASHWTNWSDAAWSPSLSLYCVIGRSNVSATQQVLTSPTAVTWTARTTGNHADWESIHWSSTHSRFIAVASAKVGGATQAMTSLDGITWTARTPANNNAWRGLTETDAGRLIAVASNNVAGDQVMYSTDGGVTWTAVAAAANRQWYDIAYSPSLERFVAVAFDGDPMYSP